MYDESDGGRRLRLFNCVNLAWWHNFKHCAMKLWQKFARELFAPLWHFLYPNGQFNPQPKSLSAVILHFLYLFKALPYISDTLDELLKLSHLDLSLKYRLFIQDLNFLLRMAIPVVTSIICLFPNQLP